MKKKQSLPFYFLVFSVFLFLVSPHLLSDGMFMDGLLYAAISNNLSNGYGSFWNLLLSNTLYPTFHEHPPLAFGIQSLFFDLFGESRFVERGYSFCCFIITGFIIANIWRKITPKNYHKLSWLPLFFWVITPLVSWSASNNMLENTMMIFTSFSVLLFIRAINENRYLFYFLGGVMLFLGFLTKGFVSLFPLSILLWQTLFRPPFLYRKLFITSFLTLFGIIIPFLVLFVLLPESYISLEAYFEKQVVGSITSIRTVDNRFWILWKLLQELIPGFILVLLFLFFSKVPLNKDSQSSWFLVLLAVGLSGVIPIMISLKQSGFYITAAFPIFSIAFSLLIKNPVNELINKIIFNVIIYKRLLYTSFSLLILSLLLNLFFANTIQRDNLMLNDVFKVITVVPENSTISITNPLRNNWSLHGYFQRYGYISLDRNTNINHSYKLVNGKLDLLPGYQKLELNLNTFTLYEKL
tara:strand:- start:7162 stop:8562 length:1401 start_codon:yes stop_codon:yes gene_type:complete